MVYPRLQDIVPCAIDKPSCFSILYASTNPKLPVTSLFSVYKSVS